MKEEDKVEGRGRHRGNLLRVWECGLSFKRHPNSKSCRKVGADNLAVFHVSRVFKIIRIRLRIYRGGNFFLSR